MDLSWGCSLPNSPPEITEIIFPVGDLRVGLNYHILANATDPDGDTLTYTWSVSDGIINPPLGNPLIWTTPGFDGNYEITLVVDDGNGGTDTKTESVIVYPLPPSQQSMEVPIDEAGNIVKDNTTNTAPNAPIVVGDHITNNPFRGFVSFDIRDLAGTTINNATLMFTNSSQNGDPYNQLIVAFWVKVVNWGDDALELGDFDLPSSPLGEYPDPNITISSQALKDALQIAINNGSNRFQIMISHKGWQTNHNNASDYIRYYRGYVHLNVDFTGP